METDPRKEAWEGYCARTLAALTPLLAARGISLDATQPHLMGERYLIRPLSAGRKVVLIGHGEDGRVVVKASDERNGIEELRHERACRDAVARIPFAYEAFPTARERSFFTEQGYTVMVTEYLAQDSPFLDRPLLAQFDIALSAFKAQEGTHATTAGHYRSIGPIFERMDADRYLESLRTYEQDIDALIEDQGLASTLAQARTFLETHRVTLDQYGGFLTHWDFTPQNFRVRDGKVHFLDLASLRFGNKYEGWARFVNFMELYNPPLAAALVSYVALNRTPEESLALRMMRLYRLVELIRYYANWLPESSGNVHELAQVRIGFWHEVLSCVLADRAVPPSLVDGYKTRRDALRSPDEQVRQTGLH